MERNDDLIRRSALIAEYDRVHVGAPGGARKLMQDAPAVDAVEVVRCKDCKYQITTDGFYACHKFMGENVSIITNPNNYCSFGRRREV